ncbi:MAG: hypothetical protein JOZ51_12760 [Chloroflexi bacterium]|nr:hypothetical protein [Chloroflexota bacterium]
MSKFTGIVERFLAMLGVVAALASVYLGVLSLRDETFRNELNPFDPTNTPVVVVGITQIPVTVIPPTYTPLPTYTPQPTLAPLPTYTPAPTSEPIVRVITPTSLPPTPTSEITADGSVLEVGQTWNSNGISATLSEFKLLDQPCDRGWPQWGVWTITISNNTKDDLAIGLTTEDTYLVDDSGESVRYYVMPAENEYCTVYRSGGYWIDPPGQIAYSSINSGQRIKIRVYGVDGIEQRQWFEFGIRDAGRIQNAKWRINIPR